MSLYIPLIISLLISTSGSPPAGPTIDGGFLSASGISHQSSDQELFLEQADRALAVMVEAAGEMSVQGVAVVAFIPGNKSETWISKMKVAGALTNGSANFLAVAYSKAAEMADTRKNSGNRDGEPMHGEFGYEGGVLEEVGPGYLMAVFSGATGEQDTEIAKKGLEILKRGFR